MAEVGALSASGRSPKDRDRIAILRDAPANVFGEVRARRAVSVGDYKVLPDRLRAALCDQLYNMPPQNTSIGLRLVFVHRPMSHIVAEGEPAQRIRVRRHELIAQIVFVSFEIRQTSKEIEGAEERLGLGGASARALN